MMVVDERDMKIIIDNSYVVNIMKFVPEGYSEMKFMNGWCGYKFYLNKTIQDIIAVRKSDSPDRLSVRLKVVR